MHSSDLRDDAGSTAGEDAPVSGTLIDVALSLSIMVVLIVLHWWAAVPGWALEACRAR